jgi:hypothetical protein
VLCCLGPIKPVGHSRLLGFAVVRLKYIPGALLAGRDAADTTKNIAAHKLLFRFGIVSDLITAAARRLCNPSILYHLETRGDMLQWKDASLNSRALSTPGFRGR